MISSRKHSGPLRRRLGPGLVLNLTGRMLSHRRMDRATSDTSEPHHAALPLPAEIIAEVAAHLPTWDILSLGLTVRSSCVQLQPIHSVIDLLKLLFSQSQLMYSYFLPSLYASVDLKSTKRCHECLEHLISRPDIAGYVRTLVLQPNYLQDHRHHFLDAEKDIATTLSLVIPNLRSLKKFLWDGLEMPEDHVWAALRHQ